MVGGATEGYCDTGSCVIDTMPAITTKMAITQAKIGRWMKNLGMVGASSDQREAAAAGPDAAALAAACAGATDEDAPDLGAAGACPACAGA